MPGSTVLRRIFASAGALTLTTLALLNGGPAAAETGLPSSTSLADLAAAARPEWNFARALSHDSCWPEAALDDSGAQKAGASRKNWPVPGQGGCVGTNTAFPTYYTAKACTNAEVRVVYTIYFPKDGFAGSLAGNALGHTYDFEHVIVVWAKGTDGLWHRDHLLLGRHGNHVYQAWSTAESWDATRSSAGVGLQSPRIYVGWAKHAMFNHTGGLTDLASQYTNNEYRSAKHPYWADTLISVGDSGGLADRFDANDWGDASSTPAVMSRSLCSIAADS